MLYACVLYSLLIALLAPPASVLGCLQVACTLTNVCTNDTQATLTQACEKLREVKIPSPLGEAKEVPLVGEDGCGWASPETAPATKDKTSADAKKFCKGESTIITEAEMRIWRAKDDGKTRARLEGTAGEKAIEKKLPGGGTIGGCKVVKSVYCSGEGKIYCSRWSGGAYVITKCPEPTCILF